MTGIKSTVEMVYDARSNAFGMIEVEILGWTYEPEFQQYVVTVADYFITTREDPILPPPQSGATSTTVIVKNLIIQKNIVYTKEQIDSAFIQIGNPIELTESFTDEIDVFIAEILLLLTHQNPIYRVASTGLISTAEDWVLNSTVATRNGIE